MNKGIDIIKQVKEKLGKSADAGDYIDDFKKSDAPQFKGKSDKKKEKMAVAAYLDSKEEVDSAEIQTKNMRTTPGEGTGAAFVDNPKRMKEETFPKLIWKKNELIEEKVFVVRFEKEGMRFAVPFRDMKMAKDGEKILKKSSGVSNLSVTQDVLKPGMKLSKEQVGKITKEEVKEEKRQLKDPKKEAMVMKVKDSGSIQVIDKKDLEKYLRKGYIQVEDNIQESLKLKYAVVDTSKNNEVVAMSSDEKEMQYTMRRRKERSLKVVKLKRPTTNDSMIGYPLKEENCPDCDEDPCKCKSLTEAVAQNDAFVVTGGPGDNAQKVIAVFKDKGNGLKDAKKARDDYNKKNKPTKKSHFARIYRQTRLAQAGQRLKPGEKIMYSTFGNKHAFTKLKEDIQESGHTDVASMKTQVQIATDALQKMNTELGKLSDEEDLPTWWTNKVATAVSKLDGMADYIGAKQDMGKTMKEEYKSLNESAIGCLQSAMIDNNKSLKKESKMGELFLDMQMDAQEMDEREFIKVYTKKGFQAAELKSLYKEFSEEVIKEASYDINFAPGEFGQDDDVDYADMVQDELEAKRIRVKVGLGDDTMALSFDTNVPKRKMIKMLVNMGYSLDESKEVDNSLMSQATRVISQTAIQEKIDPADVDNIATADDRKAADKNIIIQLRRAQDMKGKADVTFKDNPKKKEKIDIRVINKVLDMFDSLRPNDKAKMQTTIGKSYRDLLKTVQRGR